MRSKEAPAIEAETRDGAVIPDRADDILRAAAEIICRKGFDATSMSEIARAVDLTKAGLYYYIRGKQDLDLLADTRIHVSPGLQPGQALRSR